MPLPEVYGDAEGDTLLIGWGSTYGPIHDAAKRARAAGEKIGAIHLRHLHPLPNGLEKIFAGFKRIVVVEMNDQGIYGFGQLATILRARYCEPKIESVTKTDGLTFRVREILERTFKGRTFASRNGANGEAAPIQSRDGRTAAATERAEAKISSSSDRAGDSTPTKPGTEAVQASSGKVEHSKHPASERAEGASVSEGSNAG